MNPAVDLSIITAGSDGPTPSENSLAYTHQVTNSGPSEATGVVLIDTIPGGVSFVSATVSQGRCNETDGTVTCLVGVLNSGDNATITVFVVPGIGGDLTTNARVTSNEADASPGNNASAPVRIIVPAPVEVLGQEPPGKPAWLQRFLILSAILFSIGLYGALARRNLITVFMSIELMFNAVNITLVAFSKYVAPVGEEEQLGRILTGQVFALFIIAVAAAEIVVGLGLAIALYRSRGTVDVTDAGTMKW